MPEVKKRNRKSSRRRPPGLDGRLAQALSHPTRTQIIAILSDRVASPSELSKMMGAELSSVSYHTRELLKLGCIEVVDKEQVRGATKTRYRGTTRMLLGTKEWERLSKETRVGISINALNEVIERATSAVEAGTFDRRTDRALITVKLDADDEAWGRIQQIVNDAYERISEVEAEMVNRSAEGADTVRMTVSLLAYESPLES
ncbi:MAG TPA: ArsR family transcriptional regulator [Solirubrobacterales bacterium]|nr:ArsR family transcriptional regulator [Solirubrobacterales bacterium]